MFFVVHGWHRIPRRAHIAAWVAASLWGGACTNQSTNNTAISYEQQVERDRLSKDEMFLSAADSPVLAEERGRVVPLAYFPVDAGYRVAAALEPADDQAVMEMPTSTGQRRAMRRAGVLAFSLKGQKLRLTAFVEASDRVMARLFLPFGDLTNGTETYAAGRYLDLDRTVTGLYDLDFNRAYHPYCYYNPTYDCPYPPAENRLSLPVRAGERVPRESRAAAGDSRRGLVSTTARSDR